MTVSEESLAWLHCSLLSSFSISIEPRLAKHSPEIINTYCHCMTVCQCVTGDLLWSQHPTSLSHTGPPCQDIIIIGKVVIQALMWSPRCVIAWSPGGWWRMGIKWFWLTLSLLHCVFVCQARPGLLILCHFRLNLSHWATVPDLSQSVRVRAANNKHQNWTNRNILLLYFRALSSFNIFVKYLVLGSLVNYSPDQTRRDVRSRSGGAEHQFWWVLSFDVSAGREGQQ